MTKIEDLEMICFDFYKDLYSHKKIVDEALMKVTEGLPPTFTDAMNEALDKKNHGK